MYCWTMPLLYAAGKEGSPIPALETYNEFVQLQSIKRTQQGTFDQILHH
jgi:hypothetical protein